MLNESTPRPSGNTDFERKKLDRDELARLHGFITFADLLDISDALPMSQGETSRSYLAKLPGGNWFIWKDPGS